jgi:peptide/nickel transport system permease protein
MKRVKRIAWAVLLLAYLVALFPSAFALYAPEAQHREFPYARPGVHGGHWYPLGTDEFGRDVYSRLCHGATVSLLLAPASVALSLLLALLLGGWAGYLGGWTDRLVMRAGEVFMALPWFYFVVALRAALPLDLSPGVAVFVLFALLGCLGWAAPARLFRGQVLQIKTLEFVAAARALGAGHLRILCRHLLPSLWPALRAQLLLSLPAYILTEVNLSFLGLGVVEPTPTWGNLLAPLQNYVVLRSYPWMFAPAVALAVVLLALHSVAEPDRN